MTRVILHADLNSFFARAEQQTNPILRGKPVGVVKAKGRTCIIAASVEAKKYGVTTGCRVNDAKKLCPQIILVPADFDKYSDISHRFIKICADYSPSCEVFSLDECFIDVTQTEKFWGHVFNIAFEIKNRIREEIGDYITCSIGVSHNKLLAKLASGKVEIKAEKIDLIITKAELNTLAGDKKKMKKYANQVDFFFGEAPLMPFIGKTLGTILGPRDKVPKPIPPTADLKPFLMATKKTIKIRIRESPVIQVAVGTEEMKDEDIAKNSDAVLNFVRDKMPKGRTNIKNAYIKLTMGKPIKLDLTQLK